MLKHPRCAHRANNTGCGRQRCGDEDQRNEFWVGAEDGASIESKPSKPEQKDTNSGKRHVMASDRPDLIVDVFPKSWSEDDDAGKRSPPSD